MKTKDGEKSLLEVTPENYICPAGEELSYHAIIENTQFDGKTGRRISSPTLQKFGKKEWEGGLYANLRKLGYSITLLHNPNDTIAEWQKQAEENAVKKAELAAKEKAAERERMKAELLAELKAEMKAEKKKSAEK